MPIKTSEAGRRWVEMEVDVPGPPEEVWRAMATGPGNSAWFTKTMIEEHAGGMLRFDFGAMGSSRGEVTIWEPPLRFGYVEREWNEGAPPVETEIIITSEPGGRCSVLMAHTLETSSDEWDGHLESFENGWQAFFKVLGIYLTHFPGIPAACFTAMAMVEADEPAVWERLTGSLGVAGATVGEERTTAKPERLRGIVEHVQESEKQRVVLLRLTDPSPGVAMIGSCPMGDGAMAAVTLYYYGEDAGQQAALSEATWRDWFRETFEESEA